MTVHFSVWLRCRRVGVWRDDGSVLDRSREAEVAGACHDVGHEGGEPIKGDDMQVHLVFVNMSYGAGLFSPFIILVYKTSKILPTAQRGLLKSLVLSDQLPKTKRCFIYCHI